MKIILTLIKHYKCYVKTILMLNYFISHVKQLKLCSLGDGDQQADVICHTMCVG